MTWFWLAIVAAVTLGLVVGMLCAAKVGCPQCGSCAADPETHRVHDRTYWEWRTKGYQDSEMPLWVHQVQDGLRCRVCLTWRPELGSVPHQPEEKKTD